MVAIMVVFAAGLLFGVSAISRIFSQDLPDADLLATLAQRCQVTSVFEDRKADQPAQRLICPTRTALADFAEVLPQAVIASEDQRFLYHDGVDEFAILGAAWRLSLNGASTLTQQVVRTLFLSEDWPAGWPRVALVYRKVREWRLALMLENRFTKAEIMAMYLNIAPFSKGLFGFEAAARYYFGKSARQLDAAEAAFLVALLPAPAWRDPGKHPQAAYQATLRVLERMREVSYLDAKSAAEAREEAKVRILHWKSPASGRWTRLQFQRVRDYALGELAGQGLTTIARDRVFLTLDPMLQREADTISRDVPDGYRPALAFVSPQGDVQALSGLDYGQLQWNAPWLAERSVGSIGKIMLYALAVRERPELLKRKFSTAPLARYSPAEQSRCIRLKSVTLDEAIKYSCNRPFVRLAAMFPRRAAAFVRELGFSPPDNPLLIGTGGVHGSPLAVARLFAMLQNRGLAKDPHALVAVVGPTGNLKFRMASEPGKRMLLPEVAGKVLDTLVGPTEADGTAHRAAGHRHALLHAKTGTSDGFRDAWVAGSTRDFAAAVMIYAPGDVAKGQTGGHFPAEALGKVMDAYWPAVNFREQNPVLVDENFPAGWEAESGVAFEAALKAKFPQLFAVLLCLAATVLWLLHHSAVAAARDREDLGRTAARPHEDGNEGLSGSSPDSGPISSQNSEIAELRVKEAPDESVRG